MNLPSENDCINNADKKHMTMSNLQDFNGIAYCASDGQEGADDCHETAINDGPDCHDVGDKAVLDFDERDHVAALLGPGHEVVSVERERKIRTEEVGVLFCIGETRTYLAYLLC